MALGPTVGAQQERREVMRRKNHQSPGKCGSPDLCIGSSFPLIRKAGRALRCKGTSERSSHRMMTEHSSVHFGVFELVRSGTVEEIFRFVISLRKPSQPIAVSYIRSNIRLMQQQKKREHQRWNLQKMCCYEHCSVHQWRRAESSLFWARLPRSKFSCVYL